MSLESKITLLIAAIEANTVAIAGVGNVAPVAPSTPAPVLAPVAVPAPPVAAPVTPAVAAPAAVASPSNITIEQLQQEVTAIYQTATPDVQAQIGALIQAYGAITAVPVDQTNAVLAQVKAL